MFYFFYVILPFVISYKPIYVFLCFYIFLCLYIFFFVIYTLAKNDNTVPPEEPKIFDAQGKEISHIAGPFREGHELFLSCQVTGGEYI